MHWYTKWQNLVIAQLGLLHKGPTIKALIVLLLFSNQSYQNLNLCLLVKKPVTNAVLSNNSLKTYLNKF